MKNKQCIVVVGQHYVNILNNESYNCIKIMALQLSGCMCERGGERGGHCHCPTVHGIIDQLAGTVVRMVTTGCAFRSNDRRKQEICRMKVPLTMFILLNSNILSKNMIKIMNK